MECPPLGEQWPIDQSLVDPPVIKINQTTTQYTTTLTRSMEPSPTLEFRLFQPH